MRQPLPFLYYVKNFLSYIGNRQFLTFLFFLLLSASFWLFQTVNETYEEDFEVPVRLVGVPNNVVVTTEPPEHIRITLRDRGFVLLRYRYAHKFAPITINFEDVATTVGHVTLPVADLLKPTTAALESSTQLLSIKQENIEFFYNYGQRKRVPVVLQGKFLPDSAYAIMATDIEPRTVLVYASKRILDTLTAAYVDPLLLRNLKDTTVVEQAFVRIPGVKYIPDRAKVTVIADRLVEKTVEVPVEGVNFPAGKTLRTFPTKVKVSFLVGMSQYKKITAESFVIVVKYADLLNDTDNTCELSLKSTPYGVRHPRIQPERVEYVIEDTSSDDERF